MLLIVTSEEFSSFPFFRQKILVIKVKLSHCLSTTPQMRMVSVEVKDPYILDLSTRWKSLVSQLYCQGKSCCCPLDRSHGGP